MTHSDYILAVASLVRRSMTPLEQKHLTRMVLRGMTNHYEMLHLLRLHHNLGK